MFLNFNNPLKIKKILRRSRAIFYLIFKKRIKKDESGISKSYDIFSYIIILLAIVWVALNIFSVYKTQEASFKEGVYAQKTIIENDFNNSQDAVSDSESVKMNSDLKTPTYIADTTYVSYHKSEYPFLILTSHSKEAFWNSFVKNLTPTLLESLVIIFLFICSLSLFKRIKIVPIIKELAVARKKAEEVSKSKRN
jgi:hypothetical protein